MSQGLRIFFGGLWSLVKETGQRLCGLIGHKWVITAPGRRECKRCGYWIR